MDKTTTWLVRGASAIVIIFGVGYFAKPQITKLANYISKSIAEKNEYKKLSQEEKGIKQYQLAKERCLNLKEISYAEFIKKLDNNEIKKWLNTPIGSQINTRKGKYLVAENISDEILEGFDAMGKLYEKNIFNPQDKNLDDWPDNQLSEEKYWKMTCR